MSEDWRWLIGILVVAATAVIGGFRNVYKKISDGHAGLHEKIETVKKDYVPKDHLDIHMKNVYGQLDELKQEIRDQMRELKDTIERRPH